VQTDATVAETIAAAINNQYRLSNFTSLFLCRYYIITRQADKKKVRPVHPVLKKILPEMCLPRVFHIHRNINLAFRTPGPDGPPGMVQAGKPGSHIRPRVTAPVAGETTTGVLAFHEDTSHRPEVSRQGGRRVKVTGSEMERYTVPDTRGLIQGGNLMKRA